MAKRASLQALIHRCLDDYARTHRLSPRQWQVCAHIGDCRTAALGGFDWVCDACGHHEHLYHACRDRHCPRCQRSASEQWCERQREAVLPVTYYHVVFTLPHDLNAWVELQPRLIYAALFASVWATLSAFAADPKRLDGRLGMTAVLHTWGQTLTRHVHLHCLIPGGAIAADGTWHAAHSTMLFPVRALSRHVRGGLVSRLRAAAKAGELACIAPARLEAMLDRLMCATDRLTRAACPMQRAARSDPRGPATALGQMPAKPSRSRPPAHRQPPMTHPADPKQPLPPALDIRFRRSTPWPQPPACNTIPYIRLLGIVDFPRPDPARALAPHLILLDDGHGVNLGRIARISRRPFQPTADDLLYLDHQAHRTLLFADRRLSKAFIAERAQAALGQLLGYTGQRPPQRLERPAGHDPAAQESADEDTGDKRARAPR